MCLNPVIILSRSSKLFSSDHAVTLVSAEPQIAEPCGETFRLYSFEDSQSHDPQEGGGTEHVALICNFAALLLLNSQCLEPELIAVVDEHFWDLL